MSNSDYHAWLHDRHANMPATPPELIAAYVHRATGRDVASSTRLVIGHMNEVYDVETNGGPNVIVRLSRQSDPRFEAEHWALDAARTAGAPAPRVLLAIDQTDHGFAICVEEKLRGTPLDSLLGQASPPTLGLDLAYIGRILATIHSVKVTGFGYLQAGGKAWDIPFSHVMLDTLSQGDELMGAAQHWDVPESQITRALSLLKAHQPLYAWDDPRLVHGDFTPPHLLVEEGNVTGVIDFQECSGNHPVIDFVHWHTSLHRLGQIITVQDLIAVYPDKQLFDDAFDPLFNLALIRSCLWMLMVRIEQDNPHDIGYIKQDLEAALKFFK